VESNDRPTARDRGQAAIHEEPVAGESRSSSRRINFDVSAATHRRLRIKAATHGVTVAEVGRHLLEHWLDDEESVP
jgi:hypothetical protein